MRVLFNSLIILMVFISCQDTKSNKTEPLKETSTRPGYEDQIRTILAELTVEEKIKLLDETNPEVERLDMPAYNFWNEALHGVGRAGRATVFPQPIGLAASFDEDLVERVATVVSDEARAKYNSRRKAGNLSYWYSGLTFWTPNVNLFRDPRWGRGLETYGEDPYLLGALGGAYVRGLQGDHPDFLKTAGCAKHYVVHSGPEQFRHNFNAEPTMIDFYNTYLPAFRTLVTKDKVEAVMTAYNRTFGVPCASSKFLVQDILRDKWGFEGHLVTDCWSLDDFSSPKGHQVTETKAQGAAQVIEAGVSIFCGPDYFEDLLKAYNDGLITEEQIDGVMMHSMRTRYKLGLLDNQTISPWDDLTSDIVNDEEKQAVALEAAQKSIVLLKNNGVLPLSKNLQTLFVTGPAASSVDALLGNYHGVSSNMVTVMEGIAGHVSDDCMLTYRQGFHYDQPTKNPINYAIIEARESTDAAIVVLGLSTIIEGEEGEAISSSTFGDKESIELPKVQLDFLRAIRKDNDKPIIAVVMGGSPIALGEISELADAVIMAWYPGEQGGNAVADVIFGDVNPSGKLPLTFPKSTSQLPDYDDYSMKNRTYRYVTEEMEYPFGFGLSYTTFSYANLSVSKSDFVENDELTFTLEVTNKGDYDGEEVLQLYVKYPLGIVYQPNYDLKATKRVKLKSGETQQITITLPATEIRYYQENGSTALAKGEYNFFVGGSQPNKRSISLGAATCLETKATVH